MIEYCIYGHYPMLADKKIFKYKDVEQGFDMVDGSFIRKINTKIRTHDKFAEIWSPYGYNPYIIRGFHSIDECKFYVARQRIKGIERRYGLNILVQKSIENLRSHEQAIRGEYTKTMKYYEAKKNFYPEYFI